MIIHWIGRPCFFFRPSLLREYKRPKRLHLHQLENHRSDMTELIEEKSVLKIVQRTNDFVTGWKAALVKSGCFDDPFLKQISSQEFDSSFEKHCATLWIIK